MKNILFGVWHTGSATPLVPVIRELQKETKVSCYIQARPNSPASDVFESAGIPFERLDDVSEVSLGRIVDACRPDLIVTGTSIQDFQTREVIEQNLAVVARERKIPSLAVLDFWSEYRKRFSNIYSRLSGFGFLPDRIAVMDNIAKEEMISAGLPEERIVVTGNPAFDSLMTKARTFSRGDAMRVRWQIVYEDKAMFYAGDAFMRDKPVRGYWDLDALTTIRDALESSPKDIKKRWGVAVRLHPRAPAEDVSKVDEFIKEYDPSKIWRVRQSPRKLGSQEIVLASDLTAVAFSTLGVEAVYMGKPCISLQPGLSCRDDLIVSQREIIPRGYSRTACIGIIKRILGDENYLRNMSASAAQFRTDGMATERVVSLARKMLGSS